MKPSVFHMTYYWGYTQRINSWFTLNILFILKNTERFTSTLKIFKQPFSDIGVNYGKLKSPKRGPNSIILCHLFLRNVFGGYFSNAYINL